MQTMVSYKAGDRITQWCFGCPEAARAVTVTARYESVKNGRPGFDGYTDSGVSVWGYDTDVHEVLTPAYNPSAVR